MNASPAATTCMLCAQSRGWVMQAMQDRGELPEQGICVLSLFDGIGGVQISRVLHLAAVQPSAAHWPYSCAATLVQKRYSVDGAGAIVALQRLQVKVRILFTCEKDRACEEVVNRFVQQKMCTATHRTEIRALGDLQPPVGTGKKPIDRAFVQGCAGSSARRSGYCLLTVYKIVAIAPAGCSPTYIQQLCHALPSLKSAMCCRLHQYVHLHVCRMLKEYGCHLVIGGSPCNNISGNNRQPASSDTGRAGFAGRQSQLFHEFVLAKSLVWEEARYLCQ